MTWTSLILLIALGAGAAAFWRISSGPARQRRRLEDALKHLFEEEYRGRSGSLSSLGGALRLPGRDVVTLVETRVMDAPNTGWVVAASVTSPSR